MKRVAFVVQRAGREVNGGAESLCLNLALHMAAHWKIEVLTTCALDYMTWANYYPAGFEVVGDIAFRRFPVSQERNVESFTKLCARYEIIPENIELNEAEEWMRAQGPWVPELFQYITHNRANYDAFIFFTYLYCTSYFGLPPVSERSLLVPCAHNEWPIRLRIWDGFFSKPMGFVFNSIEERELLQLRFSGMPIHGPIAGTAVERPSDINPKRFRHCYNIHDPYLLYVGRIDRCKGCDELFDFFIRLRSFEKFPRKLVVLGKSAMPIPEHPDIIPLGFVSEQIKWDALAGCEILIMPSPFESLSIVLLEAWAVQKPVLVNASCGVLVGQCRKAPRRTLVLQL